MDHDLSRPRVPKQVGPLYATISWLRSDFAARAYASLLLHKSIELDESLALGTKISVRSRTSRAVGY